MRGEKIMKNSKLLLDGLLEPSQFLDRIVYQQNMNDYGMMNVENVNIFLDADEEDDRNSQVTEEISDSPVSTNTSNKYGQCILCSSCEPEILFLPCFDFCVCVACYEIMKNNSSQTIRCPKCKTNVDDARKMTFSQAI